MEVNYSGYPVFKGLQRPLEFMGLKGRYIYWAAATIGVDFLSFIIGFFVSGIILSLVLLTISSAVGIGLIMVKQSKGLHSKRIERGTFIIYHTHKNIL